MIEFAKRVQELPPYLFAQISKKIAEKRAQGVDVISFGIGDPDMPTPPHIIDALVEAARDPENHHYPETEGLPELRQAIAAWHERRFGLSFDPEREVLPLIGSKEGIGHIPLCLIDPGDIALVPDPGYPVYPVSVQLAGGLPYELPLNEERGFLPDFDAVPQDVAQRAKLLWLNYPSNPTAAIADLDFFERAAALIGDNVVSQSFYDEADTRYKSLAEDVLRARLEEQSAQKALDVAELAHRRLTASIDDNEYLRTEHEAQIEAYAAQVAVLKNDVGKTKVKAPVSGPVLEKHVEDRRVLAAGSPLLRIGDLDSIEIECDVLSEEVARVKEGDPVEISGKALMGATAMGRVKRIYPAGFMKISALGVEQQRVRTLIEFDNSALGLRPGTSVDLRIVTAESRGALAVPERAAFRREGAWYVFAVDGNAARLQEVEIGLRNDDWAEILSGLGADDTIIADPKNELEDGARVKPLE